MPFLLFARVAEQSISNFDANFCFATFVLGVLSFVLWGKRGVGRLFNSGDGGGGRGIGAAGKPDLRSSVPQGTFERKSPRQRAKPKMATCQLGAFRVLPRTFTLKRTFWYV